MWGALNDYANGHFYEPRFYGQNYNTFLEAFLAVPLYKMGYQAYTALPFISMCLTLFPFFYLGLFTFIKRSCFFGLVIVSIPLLLPFEHGIITSMPRGFVTGLVFASIGCTAIFYKSEKRFFFLAGLMAALAYSINSNAILLSIPCLVYLFFENKNYKIFYIKISGGLLLGLFIHTLIQYFYVKNAFYNIHSITLEFKWEYLLESIQNLDYYFNYNAPFFWHQGSFVFVIILIFAFFFVQQKNWNKALSLFIILPIVFLTFGLNKIHDGTPSLYFHNARMFLSLPLLLCFSFALAEPIYEPKVIYLWILIPLHYFQNHLSTLEDKIAKLIDNKVHNVVIVSAVKPILSECNRLMAICKNNKVDLFVIVNHFYSDAYTSGCKACEKDFPNTINVKYERRTWRLLEDENKIYKNVMLIDLENKIDTNLPFAKKIPDTYDLYLVKNNTLKTFKLLDTLKINYRAFK